MKTFFFGVKDPQNKGHFLYANNYGPVRQTYGAEGRELPFNYTILDGGLLPQHGEQEQGRIHHIIINGWTVLTMWDRTGDKRMASNASFIMEGSLDLESAMSAAAAAFPVQWHRIQPIPPAASPKKS